MPPALVCLSHLRWDFVYQRPNHLMARAARDRRTYFVEEPVDAPGSPGLDLREADGVIVVRPHLPGELSASGRTAIMEDLVLDLVRSERLDAPWLWYYTPMALPWTRRVEASAVVYDCMDELSGFRGAPPELLSLERELFARADIVFTGGRSLYVAKAQQHPNVHAFPSSVDVGHFARARRGGPDPADQAAIPHPRIGYYGVIDERLDRDLITGVAERRPDWQLVLVGPVAKLTEDEIPAAPNIHRLGMKSYAELPEYLRGWDVAMMPFARNEATRYISPTKTPEYLAGGRPVVSTSIHDVVEPYGRMELVRIADTPDDFVAATEAALGENMTALLALADAVLRETSWDATWLRMDALVRAAVERSEPAFQRRPRRSGVARLPAPLAAAQAATTAATTATLSMPIGAARAQQTDDVPTRSGRSGRRVQPAR
jgi:glycosyltransferase involved in cell wall biosynthesis